jgi:hypothetical protein
MGQPVSLTPVQSLPPRRTLTLKPLGNPTAGTTAVLKPNFSAASNRRSSYAIAPKTTKSVWQAAEVENKR